MTHLVSLVSEGPVPPLEENHLPMAQVAYGLIAVGVFALMLGALWFFRNFAANLDSTPNYVVEGSGDHSSAGHDASGHRTGH